MITALTDMPEEGSTLIVTVSFIDPDGTPFIPNTCTWSLTDKAGTVINSRDRVTLTPANPIHIAVKGDDLLFADGKNRVLLIEGTYDGTYGAGLPFRKEASFSILNTVRDPL